MKVRNKLTGVILDVISKFNPNAQHSGDNPYVSDNCIYKESELDFINIENKSINWEQRRYEIAKAVMQGILSNEYEVSRACQEAIYGDEARTVPKAFAQYAIACADALINELKKK